MDESVKKEIEALVKEDLARYKADVKSHKKAKPVRIRYQGKWLIMPSGKTIWKRIGDAKNAMLYHDPSPCYYDPVRNGNYCLRKSKMPIGNWADRKKCTAYYKEILFSSVEFVEVEDLF